jgi:glycosyltransferase involved in cell wall biosynthesis
MKNEIDFTIVTPSYNYSKYIRECLESVNNQEGVTLEHLIYDAGSTDGTLDIIREYDHVDLTVEPDKGMSDAINKGFKAAKGKWVMWLNTDDYLLPGALAKVKAFSEAQADVDVIYGCWNFIDGAGKYERTMNVFPIQKTMLSQLCYIASTATFYRRETVMDEKHFLNIRYKYVMDGEYYNRLLHAGKKFVYIPQILADFRVHDASLSLRHMQAQTINEHLDLQLQLSESRSIRRTYGPKLTRNEHINCVIDCILSFVFRINKQILVRMNRPQKN